MDHAAHAGNAAAVAHELADVAASVAAAITAVSHRSDGAIVVTGDHATPMNGSAHSDGKVPVFMYGPGARAAAARAIGRPFTADDALHPPTINATDVPLIFPFFPSGSRDCIRDAEVHVDYTWMTTGLVLAAVAGATAIGACAGVRRKKD